jgi:HD-GYP domain-containing protein (c-di-GMP phosphodiesterase class II)
MASGTNLVIETLHGPENLTLPLEGDKPLAIGRGQENDFVLASGKTVSRKHALLKPMGTIWKLQDMKSRHGTFLNGIKLKQGREVQIRSSDLITIEPFTFEVVDKNEDKRFSESFDDANTLGGTAIVQIDQTGEGVVIAQERLTALLNCSQSIHAVTSVQAVAEILATAAQAGTMFSNIAIVRPASGGRVEVLAALGEIALQGQLNLSRSLLDAALEGEPVRYLKEQLVDEQVQSIMHHNIDEAVCIPIKLGSTVVGCIYLDNRNGLNNGKSSEEDIEFCKALAEIAMLAISNLKRLDIELRHAEERHSFLLGTVSALVSAIDAKDTYTCGHSERVAWLSKELAAKLGLDATTVEQIHICGLVHDIGKIGISESILRKPAKLTDKEFDLIRAHPVIGENILKDVFQLKPVLPGVRSHHERWDGKGYPDGTHGEETPMFGRILGIADAFDAMCSSRAYRKKLDRKEVLDEITACSGSQFDPELVRLFLTIDFIHYDVMIDFHITQASGE